MQNDLKPYSPALLLNGARATLGGIRINRGMRGLVGYTRYSGLRFTGPVEIGCFDTGLELGGATDVIHAGDLQFWPFGSLTGTLFDIYSDGNTCAFRLKNQDGWLSSMVSTYLSNVEIDGDSSNILPICSMSLQLDGNGARLIHRAGNSVIGGLYSTKTNPTMPSILVEGGRLNLGNV